MRRLLLGFALVLLPLAALAESRWWLAGAGGGGGGGVGAIVIPTSGTVTLTGCANDFVSNRSAGVALTVTLCAAQPGMEVTVIVEDPTFAVRVDPSGTNRISSPETDAAGDYVEHAAPGTPGTSIHLFSVIPNEWRVIGTKGGVWAEQ